MDAVQVEGLSTTLFAIVSTAGKASSELTEPAELQDKSMQLASSVCRQVSFIVIKLSKYSRALHNNKN